MALMRYGLSMVKLEQEPRLQLENKENDQSERLPKEISSPTNKIPPKEQLDPQAIMTETDSSFPCTD